MKTDGTQTQQGGAGAAPAAGAEQAAAAAEALPGGQQAQTPPGEQGTQAGTPRTYSETEAQDLAAKLVNDAKAVLGREFKPVRDELATTKATAAQVPVLHAQLKQATEATWAAEIEASKDKPEAFNVVKRKHELDQRELDLAGRIAAHEQEKATWDTTKAELTSWKAQKAAADVAAKHGLNADVLFNLVPEGDEERLEQVASTLKSSGFQAPPGGNGGQPGQAGSGNLPGKPDSAMNQGGGEGSLTGMINKAKGK